MKKTLFTLLFLSLLFSACSGQKSQESAPQQAANSQQSAQPGYGDISVDQARRLVQENRDNDAFVILDTRTPQEYQRGHIPGAQLLNIYDKEFQAKLDSLDREKTYLVHCASGGRSSRAVQIMRSKGFEKVYHMYQGMRGWAGKGYETVR